MLSIVYSFKRIRLNHVLQFDENVKQHSIEMFSNPLSTEHAYNRFNPLY